nr:tail protein X [Mesorhizobium xinjiangense]
MVDQVCFEYALAHLGDRTLAGKLKGYVEATLTANPGLAELGVILPRGTVIDMPEYVIASETASVRLWD